MSRKLKVVAVLTVVIVCAAGITIWYVNLPPYPDTLPLGQNPSIILPMVDLSHNCAIEGYGQVQPDRGHNGFDFMVNDTTMVVAPCDGHVSYMKSNVLLEGGSTWQSGCNLRLNAEWGLWLNFESGALNSTYGSLQAELVLVNLGQYVKANQTIGYLLSHSSNGEGHVHLSVVSYGTPVCPYYYFTEPAKSVFLDEWSYLNGSISWDMSNYTWPSP